MLFFLVFNFGLSIGPVVFVGPRLSIVYNYMVVIVFIEIIFYSTKWSLTLYVFHDLYGGRWINFNDLIFYILPVISVFHAYFHR